MDISSDESEIDMDKVAKMVGNLDDLDNDLFGDALLKENSHATLKVQKDIKDVQKKVAFQDFDDDDNLLNDILSDNDESNGNSKHLSNIKENKIADLFGTKSVLTASSNNTPRLSGLKRNDVIKSSIEDERITTNKFDTITSRATVGKPTEKVNDVQGSATAKYGVTAGSKSDTAKKSLLIEDLFGTRSRAASLKDIYNGSLDKNLKGTTVSASMPNLVKNDQPANSSNSAAGFTLSSSVSKEPRRGRPKSGVIDDPLGLLSASAKIPEEMPVAVEEHTERIGKKFDDTEQSDDLPEWLGGRRKIPQEAGKQENIIIPIIKEEISKSETDMQLINQEKNIFLYPPASLMTRPQSEQANILAMQQQEHELRAATILSHQTDQLNTIVECQKNKINEQEKLFDNVVKHQVNRQAVLEAQIKLQQARIDNYIEALMKQPQIPLPSSTLGSTDINSAGSRNDENSKILELESLLHTLELEKNGLEHMVDILKEKHEKEITILENSHGMQLRYTQEAMDKLESKLRQDIEDQEKDYQKKIEKLSNEKNQQELYFKEQMENFKASQLHDTEEIHRRHSEQIARLQKEHSETLKNIVHAKELERNTIDFIESNKTDLNNIIKQSQHIFTSFETLSERLSSKDTEISEKRELYLKNQEETLLVLLERLRVQQETLDAERKHLTTAAQELRFETSQLSQHLKKNAEMYTEQGTRHEMLEKTLIREREAFYEQSKWEREHLQSLKEAWMSEQKQQMKLLARDREEVAAERAKLEVLSTFKTNSDDITRAELEAALKAAHNATQDANLERQKWQKRSEDLDYDRRRIEAKEEQLMQKAKELDELTKSAFMKRDEGIMALKEAKRIEKQHKEQLTQLQAKLATLSQQENRVQMEKIALARERLALRVSHIERPERDLTNGSLYNNMNESIHNAPLKMETHFKEVVDPQLLLLKLNLDNKLEVTNQLPTDVQTIED